MGKLRLQKPKEQFDYRWEDSIITCNYVTIEERLNLQQRHTKLKNGHEKVNWSAYMRDLRDRQIEDWGTSVVDDQNQPVPCTAENKMMVPLEIWNEIIEVNDRAIEAKDQRREDSLKN